MTSAVTTDSCPDIDVELLARLFDDRTTCDSARAAQILGVSVQYVYKLHARSKQYMASAPRGSVLPLRHDLFPLPTHPDSTEHMPLWEARDIYWWGTHTLRLRPDGTPATGDGRQRRPNLGQAPHNGKTRRAPENETTPVNLTVIKALQTQDSTLGRRDVAERLGFELQTVSRMLTITRNWLKLNPTVEELPLRHDLLPLPDHPDSTPRNLVWPARVIYRWGQITGRLDLGGEPVLYRVHRGGEIGRSFDNPNPSGQFGKR